MECFLKILSLVYYLNPFVYIEENLNITKTARSFVFDKALPDDLHLIYHLFVCGWGEGYMLGI